MNAMEFLKKKFSKQGWHTSLCELREVRDFQGLEFLTDLPDNLDDIFFHMSLFEGKVLAGISIPENIEIRPRRCLLTLMGVYDSSTRLDIYPDKNQLIGGFDDKDPTSEFNIFHNGYYFSLRIR